MMRPPARVRRLATLVALAAGAALVAAPIAAHVCPRHGAALTVAADHHHAGASTEIARPGAPHAPSHDAPPCCCPGSCTLAATPVTPSSTVLTTETPPVRGAPDIESRIAPTLGAAHRQPFPTGPPTPTA